MWIVDIGNFAFKGCKVRIFYFITLIFLSGSLHRSNKAAGDANLFGGQSFVSSQHPDADVGRAEVLDAFLYVLLKQVLDTGGGE